MIKIKISKIYLFKVIQNINLINLILEENGIFNNVNSYWISIKLFVGESSWIQIHLSTMNKKLIIVSNSQTYDFH